MTKSRISRTLLAGTVLTAAPITELYAGTITETTDFSNNPNFPTLLPAGTTQVDGHVDLDSDNRDYFMFQGLGAGTYTLTFTSELFCGGVFALNSTGGQLGGFATRDNRDRCIAIASPQVIATGAVPGDGKLKVAIYNESGSASYSVMLSAPGDQTVPEPSTFAAGLLAAGAMLWRRRGAKTN